MGDVVRLPTAAAHEVRATDAAWRAQLDDLRECSQAATGHAADLASALASAAADLDRFRQTCLSVVSVCEMCQSAADSGDVELMAAVSEIARLRFEAIFERGPDHPDTAEAARDPST